MSIVNNKILIRNGRIFDPGRGIDETGDIKIYRDKIVEEFPDDGLPVFCIDAQGDYVVPGLIDHHAHVGHGYTEAGFPTDLTTIPNCVTTVVDAGSRGTSDIVAYINKEIPNCLTSVKVHLHFCPAGIVTEKYAENTDPKYFDTQLMKYYLDKYPNELVGLKFRIMKSTFPDFDRTGLEPLRKAIEVADELGKYVCLHITTLPCSYREVLECLRPGDVAVHIYQKKGDITIIDEQGKLDESVLEARKRGVLFELAGARSNQSYEVAQKAIDQGFVPDIFSTDLTTDNMYMKPAFSLLYMLSVYKNMGVSMKDLIVGCTSLPAKLIGLEGKIGTLAPGANADVAIIRDKKQDMTFVDNYGYTVKGDSYFEPRLTIKDGKLLYLNAEVAQETIK